MLNLIKRLALGAAVATPAATAANAQLVEEVRVGVLAHNICVTDCKNADKEDGPDVEAELVFASPDFLGWALEPRPFIIANINVAGETSYGGVGLVWNFDFAENWSFEPSFAYVIHDGETDNPFVTGTEEARIFGEENLLLGSEDLFRTSFAINRDFGENWGMQLIFEHLSHGQILGDGRNQGLDNLGLRAYYRF